MAAINSKSPKVASFLQWALAQEIEACQKGQHTIWNMIFTKIFR